MQISKREFLKRLGLTGAALATGGAFGEQVAKGAKKGPLPEGCIGDPKQPWFGQHVFPLPHTIEDGPSCQLKDGKVLRPAAEIPIFHQVDVVVVGGGPAGVSAAVSAARTGAKVALVERYGSLGGLFTNGMVLKIMCTSAKGEDKQFRFVTQGVCSEFIRRAQELDALIPALTKKPAKSDYWEPDIDPEAAKYLMDVMCAEAKVETFFHSWGVDVIQDGPKVLGVVFESKQGTQAILAKQVVDCTGDGDMFFRAGAGYRQITHSIGSVAQLGNVDRIPADAKKPAGAGNWPRKGNGANPCVNWGIGPGHAQDGLSVRDLSAAEIATRKYWIDFLKSMRASEGWKEVYLVNICSQIGVRATRLLDSELILDQPAICKQQKYDDAVGVLGARAMYPAFQVPYRALLPKTVDNLLAAGRCLGAPDSIETFRLIAPCFVTGQAAGTAAALAAKAGCTPRELDVKILQKTLKEQGACLA